MKKRSKYFVVVLCFVTLLTSGIVNADTHSYYWHDDCTYYISSSSTYYSITTSVYALQI